MVRILVEHPLRTFRLRLNELCLFRICRFGVQVLVGGDGEDDGGGGEEDVVVDSNEDVVADSDVVVVVAAAAASSSSYSCPSHQQHTNPHSKSLRANP